MTELGIIIPPMKKYNKLKPPTTGYLSCMPDAGETVPLKTKKCVGINQIQHHIFLKICNFAICFVTYRGKLFDSIDG